MRAAPGAMLDDGLLEVVVLESLSKLKFLTKILPRVFKGNHVKLPSVHVFRAAEVEISADRPFTMYADGDPIGESARAGARCARRGLGARARRAPGQARVLLPARLLPLPARQIATALARHRPSPAPIPATAGESVAGTDEPGRAPED